MFSLPFVCPQDDGRCKLRVRVQPGAKKNEISGEYQNSLKIKLKAPAAQNKANKELKEFLAEKLEIKPREILLETGQKSRNKLVLININKNSLENKLSLITGDCNGAI